MSKACTVTRWYGDTVKWLHGEAVFAESQSYEWQLKTKTEIIVRRRGQNKKEKFSNKLSNHFDKTKFRFLSVELRD